MQGTGDGRLTKEHDNSLDGHRLGVAKERIYPTKDAIALGALGKPVVFIDDFLGSGDQLGTTWTYPYPGGSFAATHRKHSFPAYYMTLVATQYGLNRVGPQLPVQVISTHVIGPEYSVRAMASHPLAPKIADLPDRLYALLQKYSGRLELKDYMRRQDYATDGYHSLALAFGFEHSVPDATVPLIWAGAPGWHPLARRM